MQTKLIWDKIRMLADVRRKTAFFSVIIIGLLAHIYKFTNTLPNHDALFALYTNNNVIGSGRWFLAVACAPSSIYDLPWINGVFSLLWIGLTALVLIDYFEIKSKPAVILLSGLLVTFPCVVNTFLFEFTADAYFMSMLLATLGANFVKLGRNKVKDLVLSVVCICLSCGIYQAYLSFALLLAVCHFVLVLLEGENSNKECFRWIVNQVVVYSLAIAAYYGIWKLLMFVQGTDVNSYIGFTGFRGYSLQNIIVGVKNTARTLAFFFLSRNIFEYGLSVYTVLNLLFLATLAVAVLVAVIKSGIIKRKVQFLLLVLCFVAMPVFACVWNFVTVDMSYHMVMLQSLCVLYILLLVLSEDFLGIRFRELVCLLLLVLTAKFTIQANQVYFEMNRTIERSRATAIEMISRIHQLDDGSIKEIALVGSIERSLVNIGNSEYDEIWVNGHQVRNNLVYDHVYGNLFLQCYTDSHYSPVSEAVLADMGSSSEVGEMSIWPFADSVRIIDGVAVVKLSEVN